MKQVLVLNSLGAIARAANLVAQLKPNEPMQIEIKPWAPPRTLSANALYWRWLTTLAAHLSTPKQHWTKDDLHDICRHKFIGYRSNARRFLSDGSQLPPQLKTTTELTKSEMCHYMTQIDSWAISLDCLLPSPDDSEYKQFIRKQEQAA